MDECLRIVDRLNMKQLTPDARKVLRVIIKKLLEPTGLSSRKDVDSCVRLIESGFLRLRWDGEREFWFEPTFPSDLIQ